MCQVRRGFLLVSARLGRDVYSHVQRTEARGKEGRLDVGGRVRYRLSLPHFCFDYLPLKFVVSLAAVLRSPFFQPLRGRWDALS